MIPVAVPLVIIARTTLTDAFRSIGVAQGIAPFAQHRTALSRFLVGSFWMRTGYAVTKVTTFCGLALTQAVLGNSFIGPGELSGRQTAGPPETPLPDRGADGWR
jgi:hypothetical protein